jgi:hypothetical protein
MNAARVSRFPRVWLSPHVGPSAITRYAKRLRHGGNGMNMTCRVRDFAVSISLLSIALLSACGDLNLPGEPVAITSALLEPPSPPATVASNGAASLAASDVRAWDFVSALWSTTPAFGNYRCYDGMLQFLATLHASGKFRIY